MTAHAIVFKDRLNLLNEVHLARLFLRHYIQTGKEENNKNTREFLHNKVVNEPEAGPKVNSEQPISLDCRIVQILHM